MEGNQYALDWARLETGLASLVNVQSLQNKDFTSVNVIIPSNLFGGPLNLAEIENYPMLRKATLVPAKLIDGILQMTTPMKLDTLEEIYIRAKNIVDQQA